jgi:ribonucleoside-diphosphate reductase alpha chain
MSNPSFNIATDIWSMKYRFAGETAIEHSFARVAKAVAQAEPVALRSHYETAFFKAMMEFKFLPAGRILAGAGTGRSVTLFNCFVMGEIGDSIPSIFHNLNEAAQTLQQGGGIGHDFSTLRPMGAKVLGVGAEASGPLSFMQVWDAMCRTIMSAGTRRGAMMGTLRCDHPDIEAFIAAKRDATQLRNFNISVLVSDAFMTAVVADAPWHLKFGGTVYKTVSAKTLWHKIMQATYDYAEPGVIFIDRINALNPLHYCENISSTNPCGEQPLPPYGACLLGSLNLTRFVSEPFTPAAHVDEAALAATAKLAVRFLDNVIDISNYPLPAQKQEALNKRRLGLGLTGLADAVMMCGLDYGSEIAAAKAADWAKIIHTAALEASAELAKEKGCFPLFNAEAYLATAYAQKLSAPQKTLIAKNGLRNGLLTSIAPTGTISLLAGNVSSGIEPIFSASYERRIRHQASWSTTTLKDYAVQLWQAQGHNSAPPHLKVVNDLTPLHHLRMQAAVQPYVDSSISKTINVPENFPFADFMGIYAEAYRLGLKGCTSFRPNTITGSILSPSLRENELCPACGANSLIHHEGCKTCTACGFALCG